MDLSETILRSCDAEKYISNFTVHGINSYILKILTEEDLKVIGIEDQETRDRFLNHCKNLQIPTEKIHDLTIDSQYLCVVLSQISVQLNRHVVNLSYALQRKDVDLCYVSLGPATLYLESCLVSLEKEVNNVESQILKQHPKKRRRSPALLLTTIGATVILMLAATNYAKLAVRVGI